MSYIALYRKFRPDTFTDVKGQDHIVVTLKNQLKANRVGHAYLFTGTRGTGKTSVAKLFAKTVNCESPTDNGPCGQCRSCQAISAGASMNVIEIDAASNNGVDNIREIVDEVSYSPAEGKYKVYIIDEVHMLSIGAFNALLKTLEEPPSYVIFILATTEVHKLPVTILSRCQRYDFKRVTIEAIMGRMEELIRLEGVKAEEKAMRYIARAADGSLRDALSLLDLCMAFYLGQELTYDKVLDVLGAVDTRVFSRLLRHVMDRNVLGCVDLLEEIVMQGRDLTQFVMDFTWYLRNLMLVQSSNSHFKGKEELSSAKTSTSLEDIIDMSTDNLLRLREEASMIEVDRVIRFIRIFSELSGQIRYANQKRILIEIALIKLCKPEMEAKSDTLLDRIRDIEEKLKKGIAATPSLDMPIPAEERVQKKNNPQIPKAIPDDIREIVSKWQSVVGRAHNPMKTFLKEANLSLGGDNKLLLVLEDGLASDYFTHNVENKKELEQLLAECFAKKVEVQIQTVTSNEEFQDNYVDLSQVIHMEIEEEDD